MKQLAEIHKLLPDNIEQANADLEAIIRSEDFIGRILTATNDHPFMLHAAQRFSFQIIPPSSDERDEPKFGCVFEADRFKALIHSFDDLMVQFLHTTLHEWCEMAWLKISEPKEFFTPIELDVLEEMYSQALLCRIAPDLHYLFIQSIRDYLKYVGVKENDTTQQVFILMGDAKDSTLSLTTFRAYVIWLYEMDPFLPATFERHMRVCKRLINGHGLRRLLKKYDNLLNGIE